MVSFATVGCVVGWAVRFLAWLSQVVPTDDDLLNQLFDSDADGASVQEACTMRYASLLFVWSEAEVFQHRGGKPQGHSWPKKVGDQNLSNKIIADSKGDTRIKAARASLTKSQDHNEPKCVQHLAPPLFDPPLGPTMLSAD